MSAIKEARITLHLSESKAKAWLKKASSWKPKTPTFEDDESALKYYQRSIRDKADRKEAEDLLDLAIIKQVYQWKTEIEKTLRCSWSWWDETITSILEDRWCTNISIEDRRVKVWLVPYYVSDIKFSVKEILESLE